MEDFERVRGTPEFRKDGRILSVFESGDEQDEKQSL